MSERRLTERAYRETIANLSDTLNVVRARRSEAQSKLSIAEADVNFLMSTESFLKGEIEHHSESLAELMAEQEG